MAAGIVRRSPVENSSLRTYPSDIADAALLDNVSTDPRLKWASQAVPMEVDTGATASNKCFVTQVRLRPAAGRYEKIAVVMPSASELGSISALGANTNFAKCRIYAWIVLADGVQVESWQNPNSGHTAIPIYWAGNREGFYWGGYGPESNLVDPPEGQDCWDFTGDRADDPWLVIAFEKTNANDALPSSKNTNYNWPSNGRYKTAANWTAAKALADAADVSTWAVDDSTTLPTAWGLLGIPMDGQKAILNIGGTSILAGHSAGLPVPGGVDPGGENSPANYDFVGVLARFGQALDVSCAFIQLSMSSSYASQTWSDGTASDWTTPERLSLLRHSLARLCKWVDLAIVNDVNNDQMVGAAVFGAAIRECCRWIRRSAPQLPIVAPVVPCGGPLYTGADSGFSVAGPDVLNAVLEQAVEDGYLDDLLILRDPNTTQFPDLGVQRVGTVTSATTNSITDDSLTAIRGAWRNSYITVGGETRVIDGNAFATGSGVHAYRTLTFSPPLAVTPAAGAIYTIEGNTSADGLHPNNVWELAMAAGRFRSEILRVMPSFRFFARTR